MAYKLDVVADLCMIWIPISTIVHIITGKSIVFHLKCNLATQLNSLYRNSVYFMREINWNDEQASNHELQLIEIRNNIFLNSKAENIVFFPLKSFSKSISMKMPYYPLGWTLHSNFNIEANDKNCFDKKNIQQIIKRSKLSKLYVHIIYREYLSLYQTFKHWFGFCGGIYQNANSYQFIQHANCSWLVFSGKKIGFETK